MVLILCKDGGYKWMIGMVNDFFCVFGEFKVDIDYDYNMDVNVD